eukprot:TRINITY_DN858_c0_g1_i5.p1 TRINITY_DN858_c0_g1~~TRINITY_DN858_c0_g1_i5.p1  ORF type:complete len:470 (-),score=74.09 TRINITY_DN858_c0_g1_i5:904-2313(-)
MSFFHELAACLRGKRFLHHMRNRENQFDDLNDPQRTESFVLPLFHQSIRFTSITELHSSLLMNAIRIGKREKSFWTQIAQITSIRRWDICDGYLTEEGFEVVLSTLQQNQSIQHFHLRYAGLNLHRMKNLVDVLIKRRNMKELDVAHNEIEGNEAFEIARLLEHNSSIVALNLEYNCIPQEGIHAIIRSGVHLKDLNLTANRVTNWGERLRARKTFETISCIVFLNIENIEIDGQATEGLAIGIGRNSSLKTLILSSNGLMDKGIATLVKGFKVNQSLENLDVSFNNIESGGMSALSRVFQRHPSLRSLCMKGNRIGDKGIRGVARLLRGTVKLKSLDLSSNEITVNGTLNMAGFLSDHPHLEEFNIAGNCISDIGCSELVCSLEKNTILRVLTLSYNAIKEIGMTRISALMHTNRSLASLVISYNEIGENGLRLLCESLHHDPFLRVLDLSGQSPKHCPMVSSYSSTK